MARMERVNASMKREIAKIIQQDLQDPRFQFVSITGVSVSPDFENARILFSFLGDRKHLAAMQVALDHAGGIVRKLVSQRMDLRRTPRMEFVYDPSLDYSANVEKILTDIKKDIPFDQSDGETHAGDADTARHAQAGGMEAGEDG